MLGIKRTDEVPNSTIRDRTKLTDVIQRITQSKWKWAGNPGPNEEQQIDKRLLERRTRVDKRSQGRPRMRWSDDIKRIEGNWINIAPVMGV